MASSSPFGVEPVGLRSLSREAWTAGLWRIGWRRRRVPKRRPCPHFNVVEENQVAQRQGGHYGVPLMVFGAEPFFGQDRLDQMKWRMGQAGLAKR